MLPQTVDKHNHNLVAWGMAHPFLTIRTTPELKAALEARAEKEGRSTSSLAVRVLEAAAKRWPQTSDATAKGKA